jgi:hypothetical protein
MRVIFTKLLLLISIANLLGQTFFEVEGKKVVLAELTTGCQFVYKFTDSLNIHLINSYLEYANNQHTITKVITSNIFSKYKTTDYRYFKTNGEDSILNETNYQKNQSYFRDLSSIKEYADYYNISYNDSITNEGKVITETHFYRDIDNVNLIENRDLVYLDKLNRKIKAVSGKDSFIYEYNKEGKLISKKLYRNEIFSGFIEMLVHTNNPCDSQFVYAFPHDDFVNIKKDIIKLLLENRKFLTNHECNNSILNFISPDNQIKLEIIRPRSNFHGEVQILLSITKRL